MTANVRRSGVRGVGDHGVDVDLPQSPPSLLAPPTVLSPAMSSYPIPLTALRALTFAACWASLAAWGPAIAAARPSNAPVLAAGLCDPIAAEFSAATPITCERPGGGGVNVDIEPVGSYVFTALDAAGDPFASNTTGVFVGLPPGEIAFVVAPEQRPACRDTFDYVVTDLRDIGVEVTFTGNRAGATCATADYQFDASDAPGASYTWDFGSGATPTTAVGQQADATFSVPGPRPITVTVTLGDCSERFTQVVDVRTAFPIAVEVVDQRAVTCAAPNGGAFAVQVDPPGDYFYTLRDDFGNIIPSANGRFAGLSAGRKLVRVGDPQDAGCFVEIPVDVRDDSRLRGFTVDTLFTRATDCSAAASGRVQLVAAPPGDYVYTVGSVSNETGLFDGLSSGRNVASVEPADVANCAQPFEFIVRDGSFSPEVAIEAVPLDSCTRGRYAFSVAAPAGAAARWDFGDGATPNAADGPGPHEISFVGPAGPRTVGATVTVGAVCTGSQRRTVDYFPDEPTPRPTVTDVSCGEPTSGAIAVDVTPSGDYVFTLNGGLEQGEPVFRDLTVGDYVVTARRSGFGAACTQSVAVAVAEDFSEAPRFGGARVVASSCSAVADGVVDFLALPADTRIGLLGEAPGASARFDGLRATTYRFQLVGPKGCTRDTSVVVTALPGPELDLGPDLTVDFGSPVTVVPGFTPGRGVVDPDSVRYVGLDSTPTRLLSLGGLSFAPNRVPRQVVGVTVTDEDGCVVADEVVISVRVDRLYEVPTAFTPNGDGVNDVWYLRGGPSVVAIRHARVFSRWGGLVFNVENASPNAVDDGWDGTVAEVPIDADVFVWTAEIEFVDGSIQVFSGELNLIR